MLLLVFHVVYCDDNRYRSGVVEHNFVPQQENLFLEFVDKGSHQ